MPNISAITQAFIDTVRAAGYQCGVYASKSWFEDYISVDADAIWLAQWASKPTYAGKFDVWQNSDSGTVPGVTGKVDADVPVHGSLERTGGRRRNEERIPTPIRCPTGHSARSGG